MAGVTLAGFGEFVTERFPFAWPAVRQAAEETRPAAPLNAATLNAWRTSLAAALERQLAGLSPPGLGDTTPGVSACERFRLAVAEVVAACDGFLHRASIRASLTPDERREILRGMILTRATDNRLKTFFTSGEVRFGDAPFQGKGFRSLGQEAIYAAAIRLRRGTRYRTGEGWDGDVVAPLIRDIGRDPKQIPLWVVDCNIVAVPQES